MPKSRRMITGRPEPDRDGLGRLHAAIGIREFTHFLSGEKFVMCILLGLQLMFILF